MQSLFRPRYATYLTLALCGSSGAAQAAAGGALALAGAPTRLDNVVVTATRTPQLQARTLAATTVITRADIERLQARSVGELLADTPSVTVANQGGPGKLDSIFMRGTNSDQVLVLVDGQRFGSATSGLAAIQDLPVSQIQRIEIVRGPRSSLYGSDAIGGVIQIFTRNGKGLNNKSAVTPYFSIGGGTYGSYRGQAGISGHTERAHYNVSVSGQQTNGFNACNGRPFGAPGGGAGCFANQPDHDGYSRLDGSFNGGYTFDNGWSVDGNYLRANGDNQYDGTTANQSDTHQEVYGLSLAAPLTDIWKSTLSLGRSSDSSDDHLVSDGGRTVAFASRFETQTDTVTWQNDLAINKDNLVTLGLDYRQDEVTSSVAYARRKRDNKAVFGEYQGRFGANEIDLAARGDDNQQFGQHATGSLTYGLHINDVYTATVSYGNAFHAPTFNDLYYPSFAGFPPSSNPDLKPEKSQTAELGFKAAPRWGSWAIHAYQTKIRDLITLDQNFTPQNLDQARIRGIEGEMKAYLGAWRLAGNANWLAARNQTQGSNGSDNYGNHLPRRPDYSLQFDVDRDLFTRFSLGATARYNGSRYDDAANQHKLGGYALFDLRGEVRLDDAWKLQAKLANLFDRKYQTVAFYNQPGRTVFFTFSYTPDGT
ncbi:MAG: TonB-dependent receptor [Salinisphaera sp.]|jgi:vitamin B12 transporter|nr:TonB-dependent receptor [Salinisphaera sp.]